MGSRGGTPASAFAAGHRIEAGDIEYVNRPFPWAAPAVPSREYRRRRMALKDRKVLMLVGPGYEDVEATKPYRFLKDNGAQVDVAGVEKGVLEGLRHEARLEVDKDLSEAAAEASGYDALVIPGGRGPANLRQHPNAINLVKEFMDSGKPVAAICHGPQMLAAADVLTGRTITGYPKIRDEMTAAGAHFVDEPVVVDDNLITSRVPEDIPLFDEELEKALA